MQVSPRTRAALACEPLERRDCPAVQVFEWRGLVSIVGDNNANDIAITDDGAGGLEITIDGGTPRTVAKAVAVSVATLGGDDTVSYTVTGPQTGLRAVAVSTGAGNDEVTLTAGNVGGVFGFAADGGTGIDTLTATVDGTLTGVLTLGLSGGDGGDTIAANVIAQDGSTGRVYAAVGGGKGSDNLTLNVADLGTTPALRVAGLIDGGRDTDQDLIQNTPNVRIINPG